MDLSVSSSSWGLGRAAVCNCGIPWTFLLPFFDTDSIIYVHKPDLWNPTIINNRLGEVTEEVPNAQIMKFVGMEPKNYGNEYVDKDGHCKSTCKVKGLALDYNTSQLIHFHRMLELAKPTCRDFKETADYQRIRKHKDRRVTTEKQSKTYRFNYNKRVILKNRLYSILWI